MSLTGAIQFLRLQTLTPRYPKHPQIITIVIQNVPLASIEFRKRGVTTNIPADGRGGADTILVGVNRTI
ncbi:hypothetical protein EKG38_12105 [Shewanella canadensis]|uniref:Uncharacterized protein n=1 Tax=Shewanella canadensis TaxID=271096 RepID=A0A431WTF5_9GAMM|nr:hypothetical protein EKG38_12105 [Shewanella canadensis]